MSDYLIPAIPVITNIEYTAHNVSSSFIDHLNHDLLQRLSLIEADFQTRLQSIEEEKSIQFDQCIQSISNLESEISSLNIKIDDITGDLMQNISTNFTDHNTKFDALHQTLSGIEMNQITNQHLNGTGIVSDDRADYAMRVHYHTEIMALSNVQRIENILRFWITRNYNQAAVRPTLRSGDCIPLRQDPEGECFVIIELRDAIVVTGLTVEHATSRLGGNLQSAPRDMTLEVSRNGHHFHGIAMEISYDPMIDGGRKYFHFEEKGENAIFARFVKLKIDANHGAEHTCLYRVQIHSDKAQM